MVTDTDSGVTHLLEASKAAVALLYSYAESIGSELGPLNSADNSLQREIQETGLEAAIAALITGMPKPGG